MNTEPGAVATVVFALTERLGAKAITAPADLTRKDALALRLNAQYPNVGTSGSAQVTAQDYRCR
jgi:hypothetical protein